MTPWYGPSDNPIYPVNLIGEGGRAEAERALSLSKKINDIRDMLIDDREDCRIGHGLATGAMSLLENAANHIDMGYSGLTFLKWALDAMKDYPKYTVEIQRVIEKVKESDILTDKDRQEIIETLKGE